MIGLRFKLLGLDTIDPNMLLSFHYGLNSVPMDRERRYYLHIEDSVNSYAYYLFLVYLDKFYNFVARLMYM